MINTLIIIGTRPQYIKIKPLYDYLIKIGHEHIIIDTCQHYDNCMSEVFIKQFGIKTHPLNISNISGGHFLGGCITKLYDMITSYNPKIVVVVGDTNSALAGAIAANKFGIKLAHIEAGIRCFDRNRPEEINRILIDELSDIHFTSRISDAQNVRMPTYSGDLEYTLLHNMLPVSVSYEDWILVTIHRKENITAVRLNEILSFCGSLPHKVVFPIHHSTKANIELYNIKIPNNIQIIAPADYYGMINLISRCRGIITDSGGLIKISPFFGKKCIIPMNAIEWTEILTHNYGCSGLNNYWLDDPYINCMPDLYWNKDCCSIIADSLQNA